jgi:hypothetical protein
MTIPESSSNSNHTKYLGDDIVSFGDLFHFDRRAVCLDCDLSRDIHDKWMKQTDIFQKPEACFSPGLSKKQRERIESATA